MVGHLRSILAFCLQRCQNLETLRSVAFTREVLRWLLIRGSNSVVEC
jgi:hypothetical protein